MFKRLREWWQMKRRGECRVAPVLIRGRVYAKRDQPPGAARAEPKAYISARILRADGRVEDLGIISKPKE